MIIGYLDPWGQGLLLGLGFRASALRAPFRRGFARVPRGLGFRDLKAT